MIYASIKCTLCLQTLHIFSAFFCFSAHTPLCRSRQYPAIGFSKIPKQFWDNPPKDRPETNKKNHILWSSFALYKSDMALPLIPRSSFSEKKYHHLILSIHLHKTIPFYSVCFSRISMSISNVSEKVHSHSLIFVFINHPFLINIKGSDSLFPPPKNYHSLYLFSSPSLLKSILCTSTIPNETVSPVYFRWPPESLEWAYAPVPH